MPRPDRRLSHHELCFGCGQANLFGLQLELEPSEGGGVEGRFFVKQDHQGEPGFAHAGVLATALEEAMSLLLSERGMTAALVRFELELRTPAPVGSYVEVSARLENGGLVAAASGEAGEIASARALVREPA